MKTCPFYTNLDFSLEWYYGEASYLSAGYFRKKVSNFIVNTTQALTFQTANGNLLKDPSTGTDVDNPDQADSIAVFTNTLPSNSESAVVDGWELALQHTFDSGFGLIANATLVDSNKELDALEVISKLGLKNKMNVDRIFDLYSTTTSNFKE